MSSYVLDRELLLNSLGSARNSCHHHTTTTTNVAASTNWIDANSNSGLVGSSLYQRTADSEIRKQMADLQDQLKMLKTDVEKKDKLINELSSVKETTRCSCESTKFDHMFGVERSQIEMTKRELSTLSTKYEMVSTELSEYKVKFQTREDKLNELKREIDTLKSENATMNALICSQRSKIKELEGDLGGFESVASKSGITITTLQREHKEQQQHVLELESRIRTHMIEREEAERRTETLINKLNELSSKISTATGITITSNASGLDTLLTKITDVINENSMLKGKLVTTIDNLTHNESENKANRETIQRLVNEINKFEKDSMNVKLTSDSLKAERDLALNTNHVLEKEIETLKERMSNIQTAWQATKTELEKKEQHFVTNEANVKQLEYDALYSKNCLNALKEQVAHLLSDGFVKVEPIEDQIKEKIKLLMTSSKDRGLMIASMEGKIQQLANQLNEQITLYKELEIKYHRGEAHVVELETRFKSLDSEYCATEVIRDNLKSDRIKYFSFLERLGHILKVGQISADVGLDMNIDLLVARAEQLMKSEGESLQDKQTNIYNLQRKVKSLKEQLDNKDLHLDLLRKKLSALEEERAGKTALEREVDDHVTMSKKFKLKVEKLTEQLSHLKCENNDLKAQLMDSNCIKGRSSDQEKEIRKLLEKISELESAKEKQSIKITKLRDELDSKSVEVNKTRDSSDGAVQALSVELRHLKMDLDKVQSREKQLLDFRSVIARMLGLDATTLAVADYEIIARIERIITAFNNSSVVLPVQVNQVRIPTPTNATASYAYNSSHTTADFLSSSSSSNLNHKNYDSTSSSSPSRRIHHSHSHSHSSHDHHHHAQRERSLSPSSRHHHHHHHHNDGSQSRARSKSPRKQVTIDPNSY